MFDKKEYMKEYNRTRNTWDYRAYERTMKGFLMRKYSNMKKRVEGKNKPHLYEGKEILSKEDFYHFAENSLMFHKLFQDWVESGYDRELSPSPDRIDSSKGYVIGNIEWVTTNENSRRGAISRWKGN